MGDLVGPILEVIKSIGSPIMEYLNYHRKLNDYVDDLKMAKRDLGKRKADIGEQLEDDNRFGKKPKQEVESWLKNAEETINAAEIVEKKVSRAKYLFRSNLAKYLFRSNLAKLVDETAQQIKKVHDAGLFPGGLVLNDLSAEKLTLSTQELVGSTPAEEIYKHLSDVEVSKIGVWGMGGIGKTTIVKNVYNKVMEETKFNKLIWTTVSQDFDIWRLQNRIALQLNEDLSYDEDTVVRAAKLSAMLRKQGRYVLILDDLWERFSLDDVGIPEPDPNNGCKLIITTRREDVVRSMCCKQVQVRRLSEDEALQLFLSKVGRDMLPNPMIESIMKLIVKECSGLPLAIVTVAGSMKGITYPFRWEDALSELQGHVSSTQFLEDKVFGSLKFSYVHLEPKLQPCFLYCALYPEDCEISEFEIIEHWLEEGLIGQMETRKVLHRRGRVFLQKLIESCLLEKVWSGCTVKMHDLVRDMALRITDKSPRFFVKAGLQLIELSDQPPLAEDLEKVSFMRNDIKKIPSDLLSSKCLKLTSLLFSENSLEEISDSFFDYMPNLKILDLSRNPKIVSLSRSLSNLVNLKALLLSACKRLRIVPSLANLSALRKLDLELTSISEIPQGLETLENLRYLNLGHTQYLREIPNGVFSKLSHLQFLVLYPASLRQEEIKGLKKLEGIRCCTDVHGLSTYVGNKMPNQYLIVVGQHHYYPNLTKPFYSQVHSFKMISFYRARITVEDSIALPSDTRELELNHCDKLRIANDIDGGRLKDATDLLRLTVSYCDDLEYLFPSWCALPQTVEFINLISLENLKNLVAESGPSPPGSFSSLKGICLHQRNRVKKLFSASSILQDLCNLEELQLVCCDRMEEIIASEEDEQGVLNTNNSVKFMLPKLERLYLMYLPNLRSICGRNVVMDCDSLQEIDIIECRKLERIPLYFSSLDNTQPSIPPSLKRFMMDTKDKDWWDMVEWDVHPNAKNFLGSIINFSKCDEDIVSDD